MRMPSHIAATPSGLVVEVYDYPQPAAGIDVAAIEVLATRDRVGNAVVGMSNGAEDELVLVGKLGAPERQMQAGAGIEYDATPIRICRGGVLLSHPKKLRVGADIAHV